MTKYFNGTLDQLKRLSDLGDVTGYKNRGINPPMSGWGNIKAMVFNDHDMCSLTTTNPKCITFDEALAIVGSYNSVPRLPDIKIGNYVVEFNGDTATIETVKFTKSQIEQVYKRIGESKDYKFPLHSYIVFNSLEQRNAIIALLQTAGMRLEWGTEESWNNLHLNDELSIHGGCKTANTNTEDEVWQWARDMYDQLMDNKSYIKVGGYAAKFANGTVSFGCTTATKEQVKEVLDRLNSK